MEKETYEAVKICIELALAAMLITVIVILGGASRKGQVVIDTGRSTRQMLETKAEFYYYDNKTVSGSDVIDCISKYARIHNFNVSNGTVNTSFSYEGEKAAIEANGNNINTWQDYWSMDFIEKLVGDTTANWSSSINISNTGVLTVSFSKL